MKSNQSEPAAPRPPEDDDGRPTSGNMFARTTGVAREDPWQDFLSARTQVIEWLVREYNWSDEQIARQLSMSAGQVQRIRPVGTSHIRSGTTDTDVTMAAPLDS